MKLVRYADRPDLRERRYGSSRGRRSPSTCTTTRSGWRFWGRLYDDFPDFQVVLVDGDELRRRGARLPVPWDGTLADLPAGWDDGFVRGMTSERAADGADGARDQRLARAAGRSGSRAA